VTLRAKLTIAFALFAALPVMATLWPATHTLSTVLEAEYSARLDQAAHAVEREYRRVAGEAAEAAQEIALGPEVEALRRDREEGNLDPAEAATRAASWMQARGLDVLAVSEADGTVVSSGHLPGRAGDTDPGLTALYASAPAGQALPCEMLHATPEGVEPLLATVAWTVVPGSTPPLRVAAGLALGPSFADRLAALTGGAVTVERASGDAPLARAGMGGHRGDLAAFILGTTRARTRRIPIPSAETALAAIEVTLPATGLAHAQTTVTLTLIAALVVAVLAATLVGRLVAGRITHPLESLRDGAMRVAAGDLGTRVEVRAAGEAGELVAAFNRMTSDLAAQTARAAAAERVAAWREVARRLAHEVKNPLTPVAMSVETLRDAYARGRPDFGEIFEEGTKAIGEEVRRLVRIVDEFGRFARLPAPKREKVATAEIMEAVLALYPETRGAVRFEHAVEADLPLLDVDRDQIVQVVHNLVRNALEAVGERGTVRLAARREQGGLAVEVSDDGPGINAPDLPRVFEPYFTTKSSGTGLGLAIAERIAQEHGGRIEVRSTVGRGATFTLLLPAASDPTGPGSP
jgi:two-component system, NtrC family, nitrogen regulation sensor histidine kinase NtrY